MQLLEKLTVVQLVEEFTYFKEYEGSRTRQPLAPILSQIN
jgi:hypothetical protein